jgi:hypothetical protein
MDYESTAINQFSSLALENRFVYLSLDTATIAYSLPEVNNFFQFFPLTALGRFSLSLLALTHQYFTTLPMELQAEFSDFF